MGMLGKDKRKGITTPQPKEISSNVVPLNIEFLVIKTPTSKCYFKRLKYKGCPSLVRNGANKASGKFKENEVLIDMERDAFVREIYDSLSQIERRETANTIFTGMTHYVRSLDNANREASFSEANALYYYNALLFQVNKGDIKLSSMRNYLNSLRRVLSDNSNYNVIKKIPQLKGIKSTITSHKAFSDEELKPIAKKLFKAFSLLANHLMSGTAPLTNPFFDEGELQKLGYSENKIETIRINSTRNFGFLAHWENNLIRCALMITFMLTGLNPTPLYNMKRKDVKFCKGVADSYTFESIKGRAGYQKQSSDIGFTKRSKEFVEKWLIISEKLSEGNENALLFPYIKNDGSFDSWSKTSPPQKSINEALKHYKLAHLTASRFRKTRSNIIMRVMNDVVEVASANNSSVISTTKSYLHGVEEDNNRQLAAAFQAQGLMARGTKKGTAINTVTFSFKDPLSEFDYKKLKGKKIPNITPSGLRCENPSGDKAKKSINKLRKSGIDLNDSIKTCSDFLDCFGCSDHALIAEEGDIWLMLSFKDTVEESLSRTAINSKPSDKYHKILNTVNTILMQFQQIAPDKYLTAIEKNNTKPHPLYSDVYSINDLQGAYA